MKVEICKWHQDALAPVIFMIDDFCNVWVDTNANGIVDLGEDWGFAKRDSGSSLVFLENEFLRKFPDVKITFFTPVGVRSGVIANSNIPMHSRKINCDLKTKEFFKSVADNPHYEVAYHGTSHGKPGKEAKDFIEEWDAFSDLEQAMETIHNGKEIFREVFDVYPRGGKYCGYISNSFSDDSIDQSGFSWWCRYSNMSMSEDEDYKYCGQDSNPLTNFDIKYFGMNNVIDIPTTLSGSLLTGVLHPKSYKIKSILKSILKPFLIKIKLKKIDYLIQNRLVVCIQEHIAPARVDGRQQMPNIFDDFDSLHIILNYLKQQRIWYCTCSELAQYVMARDASFIDLCTEHSFMIRMNSLNIEGSMLSLKIDSDKVKDIIQPDGTKVTLQNKVASIKLMKGLYFLI